MPVIDKDGADRREFRVSKTGLNPFGGRRQALNMVKSELTAPVGPNMAGLDYSIEDRDDHYAVSVEKRELRAGPRGLAVARGMVGSGKKGKGRGREKGKGTSVALDNIEDQMHSVNKPTKRSSGKNGEGEGGSFDLQSRLNTLYTVPELRREARRNGVYVTQNMRKDDIIEKFANEAPFKARRLTGR